MTRVKPPKVGIELSNFGRFFILFFDRNCVILNQRQTTHKALANSCVKVSVKMHRNVQDNSSKKFQK